MRSDAGLGAEQAVEMRTREAGLARDQIELDLGARAFGHQLDGFAHAEIGDGSGSCILYRLGDLPALVITSVDQLAEFAVEAAQGGGTAYKRCRPPYMLVERDRSLVAGPDETQALRPRSVGGKPFRIDIEDEKDRAVRDVGRNEIMRFPGIDRNDGILGDQPSLVVHIDPGRRPADMEDQVPFAMRMH